MSDFHILASAAASRRKDQRNNRGHEYKVHNKKANPCYSRKAKAKLEARLLDYSKMLADGKKDYSGYHRPGSGQR